MIISPVPVTLLDHIWPKAVPHLEKVIAKSPNEITLETIKAAIMRGDQMLVTISDGEEVIAVNVLEVVVYATGLRVMCIPITGGTRMAEWLERFLNLGHIIAKDYDCTELRGMAVRPGWLKKLKSYGWEPIFTMISCPVEKTNVTELKRESIQ